MKTGAVQYTDEFLFARLHAAWSRAVAGPRLEEFVRAAGDPAALRRALEGLGVSAAEPAAVPKALHLRLLADLGRVRELAGGAAPFYDAFIGRHFLENLKLLLRHRAGLLDRAGLEALLVAGPGLPPLRLDVLLEARNTKLFHRALPPEPYGRALLPILEEFDAAHDLFPADTKLDRLFFKTLAAAAAAAPEGVREPALRLARLEAESFNLVTLLRNAEVYHLPPETVAGALSDEGLLPPARLRQLADAADAARLVRLLPRRYAAVLAPLADQPLPARESALWALLHREARRTFCDFREPGAAVAAYPFLRQAETLNLIRLSEGVRMGLPPAELQELMVA